MMSSGLLPPGLCVREKLNEWVEERVVADVKQLYRGYLQSSMFDTCSGCTWVSYSNAGQWKRGAGSLLPSWIQLKQTLSDVILWSPEAESQQMLLCCVVFNMTGSRKGKTITSFEPEVHRKTWKLLPAGSTVFRYRLSKCAYYCNDFSIQAQARQAFGAGSPKWNLELLKVLLEKKWAVQMCVVVLLGLCVTLCVL